MKIEAVTVCVGYDDFLKQAAKYNVPLFDRWVVITEERDDKTREVCRQFNLDCVISDEATMKTGHFMKGRLIERALQHLSHDGWRVHIDADMVLPHRFRHHIETAHLDPACVYGVDRILVKSWDEWIKIQTMGYLIGGQYDYHNRVTFPEGFAIGSRWAHPAMGYVPLGAFQMWHSTTDIWRGVRIKPYPHLHNSACRTDIQHGLQWDRRKRILIPEIVAVHLESQKAPLGANWAGRKTKRFGPADKAQPDSY
jgi:hypothetical protein